MPALATASVDLTGLVRVEAAPVGPCTPIVPLLASAHGT